MNSVYLKSVKMGVERVAQQMLEFWYLILAIYGVLIGEYTINPPKWTMSEAINNKDSYSSSDRWNVWKYRVTRWRHLQSPL